MKKNKKKENIEYNIYKINKLQAYKSFSIFNAKNANTYINTCDYIYSLNFKFNNILCKTILFIDKKNRNAKMFLIKRKYVKLITSTKLCFSILNSFIYDIIEKQLEIDYLEFINIYYYKGWKLFKLDFSLFKINTNPNIQVDLSQILYDCEKPILYLNSTKLDDNKIQISILIDRIIINNILIKKCDNLSTWKIISIYSENQLVTNSIISIIGKLLSDFMIDLRSQLRIDDSIANEPVFKDYIKKLNFKRYKKNFLRKEYGGYNEFKPIINDISNILKKQLIFYTNYCGFNEEDIIKCLEKYNLSKVDVFEFKCDNGSIDIVGNKIYMKSKNVKKRCEVNISNKLVKINIL